MTSRGVNFLVGFLTGAIAGAAIGLLLAPESGEETRDLIKEKLDEYAEEGKKVIENVKSKIQPED